MNDSSQIEKTPRLGVTGEVLIIAASALLLRLPLFLLPGIGRDEAVYFLWAQETGVAYSPLLLWFTKACLTLPVPDLLALRLPSLLPGLAVLFLLDYDLRSRAASLETRLFATAALAISPWQIYAGAILHPDNLFLASLILALIAHFRRHLILTGICFGMAALAKPTGLILLPVAAFYLLRHRESPLPIRAAAALSVFVVASPVLLNINQVLIQGLFTFGRLSDEASLWALLAVVFVTLIFEGGFLPLIASSIGLFRHWRGKPLVTTLLAPESLRPAIALTMLGFFGIIAVVNHQFKANWFLPAMILLWPPDWKPKRSALPVLTIIFSLIASTAMVIVMVSPSRVARLEESIHPFRDLYSLRASGRESQVSTTRDWSQRFSEYKPVDVVATSIYNLWRSETGADEPPKLILSDDYGLAAQLAFTWRDYGTTIRIVDDPLYENSKRLEDSELARTLVLGVQKKPTQISASRELIALPMVITHPITATPLHLARFSDGTADRP
jgi:Dolichyl-phosphate-mannose-protein mannosyltransferase